MSGVRLVTAPEVYTLARPSLLYDEGGLSDYLVTRGYHWRSDAEGGSALCEAAGRVCYDSFANPRPGGNATYLGHIKEMGHGSVVEHANWSLLITGVSRSLTHELVRHRAGFAYSQESQRYVDERDVAFVIPVAMLPWYHTWQRRLRQPIEEVAAVSCPTADWMFEWRNERLRDLQEYTTLADRLQAQSPPELVGTERRKWARQAARSVLPSCTETRIVVTANARAWRNFLEQRGGRGAEPEIRRLSNCVLDVLVKDAPALFCDYERLPLPDGTFELTTKYRKI